MKKIRLITAAFGENSKELTIETSLSYKNYLIYPVFYNDSNTDSRIHSLHPRLKGKIPKMMEWFEHPDYDYYIWVDANFTVLDGFFDHILRFIDDDTDLFLFKHGKRSSIKSELDYLNFKMDEGNLYIEMRYGGELIDEQVANYLSDETFTDNHLFSGGCFMYSKRLVENRKYNLMKDWMLHNTLYSIQDQLSLPYLINKHKVKYKVYPDDLMRNDFLVHDFSVFY